LDASKIPNLDASKITTGTLNVDRIPNLDASKITTGTIGLDRIPNIPGSKVIGSVSEANKVGGYTAAQLIEQSASQYDFIPGPPIIVSERVKQVGEVVRVVNVTGKKGEINRLVFSYSGSLNVGSGFKYKVVIDNKVYVEQSEYTYKPGGEYYKIL